MKRTTFFYFPLLLLLLDQGLKNNQDPMKRKKGSGKGFIRIRIEDLLEGIRIDSENCVRSFAVLRGFESFQTIFEF